jgi:cytochrome c2
MRVSAAALRILPLLLMLSACQPEERADPRLRIIDGDAGHGRELIAAYGCGACHEIGAMRSARGRVGPPLTGFETRRYMAGGLPNTPGNLVAFLRDPPRFNPDTAMPDMGLGEPEAQDIATYLYEGVK